MAVSWLLLSGAAVYAMADYGAESGQTGVAPSHWPAIPDFIIQPDPARPTLILFAHPLCPCTRASLWELESITNRLYGMVNLHVLFYEPEDASSMPAVWAASDLKRLAATLPETQLHTDTGGRIAEKFGAYTSGQLLLYGTDQTLQFAGGITPSRGHMGSNPGRAAVISAIVDDEGVDLLAPRLNPVFGCSLHEEAKGDRKLINEPRATNDLSSAY
ncbi:MAG: hypothetical protein AB8B87_12710 [Granulosicoccus sp.]